ncbi:J domain-containing protein [Parasphingorhabdus pacifica]
MFAQSWKVGGSSVRGVDYYELLGVDRGASAADIKSAYRTLARTMHPDMGGTSGTFRLLQEAYETLNDPVRRAAYDGEANRTEAGDTPKRGRGEPSRPSRRKGFGDDPNFVPTRTRLTADDIPWWDSVNPNAKIRYLPATGPEPAPTLAMVGAWTMLLMAGLAVELSAVLLALWLSLLISAGAAMVMLLRRYVEANRTDRRFAAEFRGQVVFGRLETDADEVAKVLTAELLSMYLTRMPGVRIFHGLAWPGSVFTDVDHAVLCGRRLVLIESKRWLPGHYTIDESGMLFRNGHRFRGGDTRLPDGVAAFEQLLPDIQVRGALLIYPSRAGEVTTGEYSGAASSPVTPEQFVREFGGWLAGDADAIDREIFSVLLGQVVSA